MLDILSTPDEHSTDIFAFMTVPTTNHMGSESFVELAKATLNFIHGEIDSVRSMCSASTQKGASCSVCSVQAAASAS